MLYGHTTFDATLGLHCCALLRLLQDGSPATALDSLVRSALEGAAFFSGFIPSTDQRPKSYYASNADNAIMVINGTESLRQGNACYNGWGIGPGLNVFRDRNTTAKQEADNLMSNYGINDVLDSDRLLLVGHSYGGMIATALAEKRAQRGNLGGTRLITFGSPMYGWRDLEPILRETFITRWMNDDDPVPLLPPHPEQGWAISLVLDLADAIQFALFAHTKGGLQLDAEGNQTEQYLPTNVGGFPTLAIASWLLDQDRGGLGPHTIPEYQRRLALRQSSNPPVNQPGAQQGGVIAPLVEPRKPIQEEQQTLRAIIRRDANAQGVGPTIIPPDQFFYKVKVGNVWAVGFGGKIISIGWTRRKAGHLATAGNTFLRRLLRQALVDPTSFVEQWSAFVSAAASPDSGIRPTLNTRLETSSPNPLGMLPPQ